MISRTQADRSKYKAAVHASACRPLTLTVLLALGTIGTIFCTRGGLAALGWTGGPAPSHIRVLVSREEVKLRLGALDGSRGSEAAQPGSVASSPLHRPDWPGNQQAQSSWGPQQHQHQQQQQPMEGLATAAHKPGSMEGALRGCWHFACLRWAHSLPRQGFGRFNFPHFMLLGWPKTATTSLFWRFVGHSDVIRPLHKEPEFFTKACKQDPAGCPQEQQGYYLRRVLKLDEAVGSNLTKATFEGSTHLAALGAELAHGLAAVLPWLRLVASLREPISRHLSMLAHNLNKDRVDESCRTEPYHCLLNDAYIGQNYSHPLSHWLDAFPAQQLFIIQYERLVAPETQPGILQRLDAFLGLSPLSPSSPTARAGAASPVSQTNRSPKRVSPALGVFNQKKDHINSGGWPMRKWQYLDLVERVRPDAQEVACLLERRGLIPSSTSWLAKWELVWQRNLDACDELGKCMVQLT